MHPWLAARARRRSSQRPCRFVRHSLARTVFTLGLSLVAVGGWLSLKSGDWRMNLEESVKDRKLSAPLAQALIRLVQVIAPAAVLSGIAVLVYCGLPRG